MAPRTLISLIGLACAIVAAQDAGAGRFDVATVKVAKNRTKGSPAGLRGGPETATPELTSWSYCTLLNLIQTAYDVRVDQVKGPEWLATDRYDVVAKIPAGATAEQVRVMWQHLLAERFGLQLHQELKEFQAYELIVDKEGSKLKATSLDVTAIVRGGAVQLDKDNRLIGPGTVGFNRQMADGFAVRFMGNAVPVARLATWASGVLDRPVIDKTGLAGMYDFTLEFLRDYSGRPNQLEPTAEARAGLPMSGLPELPAALQQQLGLKLVSTKANLPVLVIDNVQRVPADN